jgi:hypothetical protein
MCFIYGVGSLYGFQLHACHACHPISSRGPACQILPCDFTGLTDSSDLRHPNPADLEGARMTEPTEPEAAEGGAENSAVSTRRYGFVKGQSGKPGGRPRAERDVRELAQRHGPRASRSLAALTKSTNKRIACIAVVAILDWASGKRTVALIGPDGGPLIPSHLLVGAGWC